MIILLFDIEQSVGGGGERVYRVGILFLVLFPCGLNFCLKDLISGNCYFCVLWNGAGHLSVHLSTLCGQDTDFTCWGMKIKLDTQVAYGRREDPFCSKGQRSRSSYFDLFTQCRQDTCIDVNLLSVEWSYLVQRLLMQRGKHQMILNIKC